MKKQYRINSIKSKTTWVNFDLVAFLKDCEVLAGLQIAFKVEFRLIAQPIPARL